MKRKITFLLAALLLSCGLSWAQQITWSAGDQGYTNAQEITSVTFDNNVSAAFNKGTNNNAPKYYTTGSAIRCYGGNYFTVSSDYLLTEIVLGFASGEGSNAITTDCGDYSNGTWTGSANEVTFTIGGTSGHRRIATFAITYTESGTSAPSITANNVEIDYDATSGTIEYTVNNGVEGGVLTAATESDWLTLPETFASPIQFTCTANEAAAARTATVTLTYAYGDNQTVTKDVTVTQAGAPVAYTTIPELFAAATSTETSVFVTFNGWVVSGVSTNGKNVFVTDNEGNGFVIYSSDDMSETYSVGNVLSGTAVSCSLKLYNGFAELLNVNADDLMIIEGGAITTVEVALTDLSGVNTGALLHYDNLTCSVNNNKYYLTDGTTTLQVYNSLFAFETLENGETYNITGIYQQYNNTKEILPRSAEDIEEVIIVEPSVTVTPNTINAPAEGADGTLVLAYENITEFISFDFSFCDANGGELQEDPDWIYAEIRGEDSLYYLIDANEDEARTAYIKVYTLDNLEEVYAIVTINQAEYVAPTYAELPFEFNGGRADIEGTDGLYQEGLGSDYSSQPKLKFDGTGDYLLLQFQEQPGTLSFDIKGNSFSGGTFTVQISADGLTYTDLATYTELDNTQSVAFDNLGESIRYIKWIYTYKSSGNVGLGNIALSEYTEPVSEPSITINPDTYEISTEGGEGTITVTYDGVGDTYPEVAFYDENGEPVDYAEYYESWITVNVNYEDNDNVYYNCDANTGEARTVYFKVYVDNVYSNMVTISQAAYVAPASITVDPAEVNADAEEHGGTLALTYENLTISDMEDFDVQFYDAQGEETDVPDWIEVSVAGQDPAVGEGYVVSYYMIENDGEARTAYFKVYALNGEELVYSNLVTITQTAAETPVGEEAWVLTNLADLTANDVFVIVGTDPDNGDTFVLPNNATTAAPAATSITVADGLLTEEPAEELQWHISGNATDGYTFYPNGDAESWLYCNNTNNGVRVGTNENNTFKMDEDGYMVNDATSRVLSIYVNSGTPQDWRCYSNYNNNPVAISFYKKVGEPLPPTASITMEFDNIEVTATGESDYVGINYENLEITVASDFGIQFYNANGEELNGEDEPDWMTAEVTTQPEEDGYFVYYIIEDNTGAERTAYFKVFAMNDEDFVYSNLVTINQEEYVAPVVPESWVLTDFADLMEGDVFVIVGDNGDTYAMPNNNGTSAPSAVDITVENDALTQEPAANLQWNLSITDNGYIFYPNGDTENWLYCISNNNGLKVGNGDNNTFIIKDDYLYNTGRERYIGIYNSQDWRSYTSINNNIAGQTFSFYKKVVEPETYTLDITGYGDNEGGYYLIASPVYVNPETTGMTQGDYDLYWFDQNQAEEWRNYEAKPFNLVPGKGYLYAHKTDTILTFAGTPYSGDGTIKLVKNDDAVFSGWNLVGNPFSQTAYIDRDYYTMKEDGSEIVAADEEDGSVEPMHGIFVIADEDNDVITFDTVSGMSSNVEEKVVINVTNNRGIVDRAIVRFGEGRQLPKFQLKENSTKVYIPQGTGEYAVVRSANQGDMPVNFKASEEGTYTFSVNTGDLEVEYLHLIDNITGTDVDLLRTPSYTFDANTTDFASRFRLVFSANGVDDNTESSNASFAFYNGSEWVISNTGAATLQVVDVMGRVLSTESINGNATANVNQVAGIYMLRLVNGDNVRVQKIVVK